MSEVFPQLSKSWHYIICTDVNIENSRCVKSPDILLKAFYRGLTSLEWMFVSVEMWHYVHFSFWEIESFFKCLFSSFMVVLAAEMLLSFLSLALLFHKVVIFQWSCVLVIPNIPLSTCFRFSQICIFFLSDQWYYWMIWLTRLINNVAVWFCMKISWAVDFSGK